MFNEIEQQWETWSKSLHARRKLRDWKKIYPELMPWSMVTLRDTYKQGKTDRMQACLVDLAQNGDNKAALTLTLQLTPALKKIARHYSTHSSYEQSSNEVLSSFFETLMKHNLRKRSRKIAANLTLDTRQKLCRAQQKQYRTSKAAKEHAQQGGNGHSTVNPGVERIFILRAIGETIEKNNVGMNKLLTSKIAFHYWFMGKTSKSIAHELNIKQTTVTTCLWRLRKQIQQTTEYPYAA